MLLVLLNLFNFVLDYSKKFRGHFLGIRNLSDKISNLWLFRRLFRCCWRMLVTKYVGDSYKTLMMVMVILVTNIQYLFTLASGTNIQNISLTSKFSHQHHYVTNITVSPASLSPHLDQKKSSIGPRELVLWFDMLEQEERAGEGPDAKPN